LEGANEFRIAFDTLKATVSGITNEIGAAFLPVAQKFVAILQNKILPVIRQVINFFSNLSDRTKTTITVIAGVVAAIGPLLFSLGALTKAIPFVIAGLTAIKLAFVVISGPIGLIGIAIAGLAVLVVQNWDIIKKTIEDSGIVDAFKEIVKNVKELALVLATNFKTSFDSAKGSISEFFNTIKPLTEYIKDQFIKQIKFLADITAQAFGFIADLVRGDFSSAFLRLEIILLSVFKRITEAIAPLLEFIGLGGKLDTVIERLDARIANNQAVLAGREAFRNYKDEIADTTTEVEKLTGALSTLSTLSGSGRTAETAIGGGEDRSGVFGDLIGDPTKGIKLQRVDGTEFVDSLAEIKQQVENILILGIEDTIGNFAFTVGESIALGANALKAGASSLINSFSGILDELGKTALQTGILTIGIGKAIEAIKSALASLSGPVAIIAGAALIALAGFARGAARSIGGRGGGSGISTSGVGSGVGTSFSGQGDDFLNNTIELALVPEITGDSIRFVLDKSNQYRN
jgi:hypothetical protein